MIKCLKTSKFKASAVESTAQQEDQRKHPYKKDFFQIRLPLYFTVIDVYVSPFGPDTLRRLEKKYNVKFENENIDGDAAVTYDLQMHPFDLSVIPMVFDDLPGMMKADSSGAIGLISHELLHAVNIIIASRGLGKNNEKNQDEVACYMLQSLMKDFLDAYKRLMNSNKKPKKQVQGNKKDEED